MKMLRELRRRNGMTMKQLGEEVGVAESTISLYENGKREADYETMLKIAEVFGVSLDYLLRGITGDGVDTDDVLEYREMLHKDKRYGVLLSASKKLKSEDLDAIIRVTQSMGDDND